MSRNDAPAPPRISTLLIALLALLAMPATALGASPLLSGYGGPGAGEQVVLGSTYVSPPPGGSGGGAVATQSLQARSGAATATGGGRDSAQDPPSSTGARHHRTGSGGSKDAPATTVTPTASSAPAGAPPVRTYPSRDADAGGLPLSAGGLAIVLIGLAALVVLAIGLRRVAPEDGPSSQGRSGEADFPG